MKGSYICIQCGKPLASSQSLWNHKQRCKDTAERKRSRDIDGSEKFDDPAFNSLHQQNVIPTISKQSGIYQKKENPTIQAITPPKTNPKMQALIDSIVNDGITYSQPSLERNFEGVPTLKKIKLDSYENDKPPTHPLRDTSIEIIEKPAVISKIFPLIDPPVPTPKKRLVDYSSDDDDESSDDDGTIDIHDLPPPDKVKFLPTTIDGLRARFEELLKNIAIHRKSGGREKTGDRNETVFLLDELKRQGGISRHMYRQYNDFLSLPAVGCGVVGEEEETAMQNEEEEQLSEEDRLKKMITSTADYLIEHDKKELVEIVNEIEKDDDIIETVTTLEELVNIYLERQFIERESVSEKIHELVDRLSNSKHISKSTLLKIKMLVNDIGKNRERVKEIVNRFNQAADGDSKDRLWVIGQLAKEKLLSEQQYFKLSEAIDELDIEQLTDVIRESKLGQGMNFLPRKTDELIDTLREWIEEFVENGGATLQNKISSVLDELLQRKKISVERYNEIKEEHNIT